MFVFYGEPGSPQSAVCLKICSIGRLTPPDRASFILLWPLHDMTAVLLYITTPRRSAAHCGNRYPYFICLLVDLLSITYQLFVHICGGSLDPPAARPLRLEYLRLYAVYLIHYRYGKYILSRAAHKLVLTGYHSDL